MKTVDVIFVVSLSITNTALAQPPDTLWSKTLGGADVDRAYSVQQTTDRGYIVAGITKSFGIGSPDFENVYLIKTDSLGDTLWTRTYGGSGYDESRFVDQTFDGGYIVAGYSTLGDPNQWGMNAYLIKTDSLGDTLWTRIYGGIGWDDARCVQQTADSGYIVVGSTDTAGTGYTDVWIIRTNRNGDTLWTKIYGGSNSDYAHYVQQTLDSGYIVGATLWKDMWLLKLDSLGDTLWTRTYGGSGREWCRSVQQTHDNGYILAGHTTSFGAGDRDIYLVKTDSLGDTLWTRTYGDTALDYAASIEQTSDSGYIASGCTYSFGPGHLYVLKFNQSGDTLWTMRFGSTNSESGQSIRETADRGYIVAGWTFDSLDGVQVYIIKIAPGSIGLKDNGQLHITEYIVGTTIFSGPLLLPEGTKCRVFDITGRVMTPDKVSPGIYFMEVDGKITQKVVKVR